MYILFCLKYPYLISHAFPFSTKIVELTDVKIEIKVWNSEFTCKTCQIILCGGGRSFSTRYLSSIENVKNYCTHFYTLLHVIQNLLQDVTDALLCEHYPSLIVLFVVCIKCLSSCADARKLCNIFTVSYEY